MTKVFLTAFFSLLLLTLSDSAWAQSVERIGNFKDWAAFRAAGGEGQMCFIGSQPKKAEGNYTRRGRIFLAVTKRGAQPEEVSYQAGYPYEDNGAVFMTVDGTTFEAFGREENAWLKRVEDQAKMINAMKKGLELVVKGTSRRGTLTTDTYSLRGFTAAYNAMKAACQ